MSESVTLNSAISLCDRIGYSGISYVTCWNYSNNLAAHELGDRVFFDLHIL